MYLLNAILNLKGINLQSKDNYGFIKPSNE
jgi:hypothetical protein